MYDCRFHGKFGTKEVDRTAGANSKGSNCNWWESRKSREILQQLRFHGKWQKTKLEKSVFFCWRNQIFQQSNPFYSVSNRDSQNEKYQSYHWLINFCSVVFPDKYLRFIGDILKHCGQCSIMKVKSNLKCKANISP